ncbi:hypothetical protein L914_08674 [Phytophthora nicotianae]|uniref:Uncharacterized protein n=1 Tax=Phytophthora nicotianae TaxID=4792 RepID=W2NCP1_PHYNI|nr:hypothetical protein L914_08674 [Phytophthora nicotianae]
MRSRSKQEELAGGIPQSKRLVVRRSTLTAGGRDFSVFPALEADHLSCGCLDPLKEAI